LRRILCLCTCYRIQSWIRAVRKVVDKIHRREDRFPAVSRSRGGLLVLTASLCTTPFFGNPWLSEKFIGDTDERNIVIEDVFSQAQDGQERVATNCSTTLHKTEKDNCLTQRELLAIVKTLGHLPK
jgi:hypothetical protein